MPRKCRYLPKWRMASQSQPCLYNYAEYATVPRELRFCEQSHLRCLSGYCGTLSDVTGLLIVSSLHALHTDLHAEGRHSIFQLRSLPTTGRCWNTISLLLGVARRQTSPQLLGLFPRQFYG
ncbi:hypothetical protein EV356DRAFT_293328 [Viridothelium virens]|uniref:Uncharacterized protein n=1 Tax=Viridothelium virens TaxID=1048519 RepID=A0A6A6H1H5_VIRVR|nr:hypothetical protein EV356DRAFT_293328 [Viridothelium virens]